MVLQNDQVPALGADARTWEQSSILNEGSTCEYAVFDTKLRILIDLVMMEGKAGLIPATIYIHAIFSRGVRLGQSVTAYSGSLSISRTSIQSRVLHISYIPLHPFHYH
jgi:hypothetical protein